MNLSSDLISQFVKVTNDSSKDNNETTVYATVVYNGKPYVKLDGSDLLTPITTTADVKDGERVTVMIKNHTATVTGNISSPSARTDDVKEIGSKISEFEIVMAYKVTTEDLEAINATIENLRAKVGSFTDIEAVTAEINKLQAKFASLEYVSAGDVEALNADIENLQASFATITDLTTEDLEALNAEIANLKGYTADFTYVSADVLEAIKANIKELEVKKLSAESADLKYANIDFANIGEAAIKAFYAKSGVIQDVVISDGQVTGKLVGVTIIGDLIEGGTVKADKLVIKGEDGLYYKLNTNGETISTEQTEYNSLSGTIITAKSITAEKIAVEDLVAFGATIGGFSITDNAIYSGVKESVDNTTRGIYLDNTGQIAFGDASNYLKFYKTSDGEWKLIISAKEIIMSSSGKSVETAISEAEAKSIVKSEEQFYQSTSPISLVGGSWSTSQPTWTEGTYIWRRTAVTYGDGSSEYTPSSSGVCITGNTGDTGADGKGILSTVITYQAGSTGTTAPTGTWLESVPETSASAPYLWTKTVITYTDGSTSASYSVGSTPEGIVVGGRNLVLDSDTEKNITNNYITYDLSEYGIQQVRGNTVTISFDAKSDIDGIVIDTYLRYAGTDDVEHIAGTSNKISGITTVYKRHSTVFNTADVDGIVDVAVRSSSEVSGGSTTAVLYVKNIKVELGNKATDWTPAPEDQKAAVDRAQSAADAAQVDVDNLANATTQKFAELDVTTEGITSEVTKQTTRVDQMEESLSSIKQTAEGVSIKIQNIIDNGVDKVTTKTGYTFDDDGLKINKSGQEIENLLDNTGMYVTRSGETILQANNKGVTATDVTVRNYLIIGTHARFEDYGDSRTACFYVGG